MRVVLLIAGFFLAAAAPVEPAVLAHLRDLDSRLAGVMQRLTVANAPLCRDRSPATGLLLHAIDQYPADSVGTVRAVFGFAAPVSVEAVVAGSPAARAGVRANDGVLAINGVAAPTPGADQTSATRDRVQAMLAALPPAAPLRLDLMRGDRRLTVTIAPVAGCRTAYEVLGGEKLVARSDGRTIQISAPFFARFSDEEIAVTAAHELAHTILRHRVRLEAAGATWGWRKHFGRSAALFRTTEDEADLLGAFLLRNAGWDAHAAVRFWRGQGDRIDGGIFRSGTHASAAERARLIEQGLAAMPADAPRPWAPPALLARRDEPIR